ncbi:MAG: hypothetical protein FJ280_27735, partial [Planctomycetes bacterium]|nr:hypothetical protein [Planctomycetota bacterium]
MAYSARSHMTMGARRRRRRRLVQRLLIVLGVLGVLAAGGALWLRQALPQIAAAQIGRLLNAHVEMGKIQLGRNGLVSVAGLVVRPREQWPGTGGSQEVARVTDHGDTILRADKVLARFDRRSLLLLAPRVTELCLQGFLLDARLNLDTGRWNFETLRFNAPPRGRGGEGLPALRLQEGKLRYCKISGVRQEVVMSVPIEARFGREALEDPSYSFSIWTSTLSGGYGTSRLTGRWWPGSVLEGPGYAVPEPAELTLSGGLSSSDLPSLERAWAIDTLGGEIRYDPSGNYSLKVNLKGLHGKHAPEVDMLRFVAPAAARAGLGQTLQAFFTEYQPTGTVESITIRAGGNTRKLHESDVEGTVVCQDISICDVSFPYRIDHLRGELEFTPSTLRVNRLQGRHGDVEVCIDGWTRVSGGSRQYQYQITSPNMVLDQALYDALDPDQKRFWDAFRPTGTVAVDYRLTRTSPVEKRLALTVDLNDVTAVYEDFPYPLVGLTGTLFFDDKSILFSDVVSTAGSRRIRVNGRVSDPAGSPTYYLSVDAQNIPLDTTLRDALPTRHRELFRQFDLEGRADIRARVFSLSDANDVVRAGTIASADVPGAESTAPKAADGAGDSWPVARGPWSGRGGPWPVARGPDHGSRITDHGPRGISFLADVSCRQSSLKLPSCLPEPGGSPPAAGGEAGTGRPLVVSGITAEATITPVSLSIRKLEGSYGGSPVAVTGGVRFDDADGLQQCRMEVRAQRVPLDEATLGLLPPALSRQVAAFHPVGEVDLTVEVKKADSNEPPEYTVVLDCLGANIQHDRFAYPLQDIRGTIVLTKDNLILKNVTAKPTEDGGQRTEDSAVLRVDGSARVADGWFENGSFTLQATRLPFTERLGGALPPALAGPYRELVPEGSFDLDLTTLQVSRDRDADTGGGGAEGEILVEFAGRMNLGPSGG